VTPNETPAGCPLARGPGGDVSNPRETKILLTETVVLSAIVLPIAIAIGAGLPLLANMFERRGVADEASAASVAV
jgi:hypothetical protein